jgi:hypothetical protein
MDEGDVNQLKAMLVSNKAAFVYRVNDLPSHTVGKVSVEMMDNPVPVYHQSP